MKITCKKLTRLDGIYSVIVDCQDVLFSKYTEKSFVTSIGYRDNTISKLTVVDIDGEFYEILHKQYHMTDAQLEQYFVKCVANTLKSKRKLQGMPIDVDYIVSGRFELVFNKGNDSADGYSLSGNVLQFKPQQSKIISLDVLGEYTDMIISKTKISSGASAEYNVYGLHPLVYDIMKQTEKYMDSLRVNDFDMMFIGDGYEDYSDAFGVEITITDTEDIDSVVDSVKRFINRTANKSEVDVTYNYEVDETRYGYVIHMSCYFDLPEFEVVD